MVENWDLRNTETQISTVAIHNYSHMVTIRLNETNPELNNEF